MKRVLIEMRIKRDLGQSPFALLEKSGIEGLEVDNDYAPIPVPPRPDLKVDLEKAKEDVFVVRAQVDEASIPALEAQPEVVKIYTDTKIEPFASATKTLAPERQAADAGEARAVAFKASPTIGPRPIPVRRPGFASQCPIPPCDCDTEQAKGDFGSVRAFLGVDILWDRGLRGEGIVVGIVDGGITAQGRNVKAGETSRRIAGVTDGWPTADWGTTSGKWGDHGNMTSSDVLGIAPNARIYDLRISDADAVDDLISNALAAYDWAIRKHKQDGTPHILSNSWGIYQESWGPDYANDPNHPFTRKVIEAINEGILVLFAAGNCGGTCPDGRCSSDNGPGKSIWGANGHPSVMTVGAVNTRSELIGYSSQGPAALSDAKPDFCAASHFRGYFDVDTGTSAACPIAAGAVALLKQARPQTAQAEIKAALQRSARNIGPAGWDKHSGYGIAQITAALDQLSGTTNPNPGPEPAPAAAVRSGIQFSGVVSGGATNRWRTWGWPFEWHVLWSVVPMSPTSSNPQIRFSVETGRAEDGALTYWVSVTNLTSSSVTVEGRYDVLNA